jgi:hypothetical protein
MIWVYMMFTRHTGSPYCPTSPRAPLCPLLPGTPWGPGSPGGPGGPWAPFHNQIVSAHKKYNAVQYHTIFGSVSFLNRKTLNYGTLSI